MSVPALVYFKIKINTLPSVLLLNENYWTLFTVTGCKSRIAVCQLSSAQGFSRYKITKSLNTSQSMVLMFSKRHFPLHVIQLACILEEWGVESSSHWKPRELYAFKRHIIHLVYTCVDTMHICAYFAFSLFNLCDQTCVHSSKCENLPRNIFWQRCCFLRCCFLPDSPGICSASDSGIGYSTLLQLIQEIILPLLCSRNCLWEWWIGSQPVKTLFWKKNLQENSFPIKVEVKDG